MRDLETKHIEVRHMSSTCQGRIILPLPSLAKLRFETGAFERVWPPLQSPFLLAHKNSILKCQSHFLADLTICSAIWGYLPPMSKVRVA